MEEKSKKRESADKKSLTKMEIIRAYQIKKRKELWCKALGKRTFEEV